MGVSHLDFFFVYFMLFKNLIMRPKFVFALSLLVVLVLGGAFLLKQHFAQPPGACPESRLRRRCRLQTLRRVRPARTGCPAPVVTNTLTADQRQAAIDAEVDRLQNWSMGNDPASLSNILADLTNPEKDIRDAAIEATEQFGSSNAIPALKVAANNTDDTQEKMPTWRPLTFFHCPH